MDRVHSFPCDLKSYHSLESFDQTDLPGSAEETGFLRRQGDLCEIYLPSSQSLAEDLRLTPQLKPNYARFYEGLNQYRSAHVDHFVGASLLEQRLYELNPLLKEEDSWSLGKKAAVVGGILVIGAMALFVGWGIIRSRRAPGEPVLPRRAKKTTVLIQATGVEAPRNARPEVVGVPLRLSVDSKATVFTPTGTMEQVRGEFTNPEAAQARLAAEDAESSRVRMDRMGLEAKTVYTPSGIMERVDGRHRHNTQERVALKADWQPPQMSTDAATPGEPAPRLQYAPQRSTDPGMPTVDLTQGVQLRAGVHDPVQNCARKLAAAERLADTLKKSPPEELQRVRADLNREIRAAQNELTVLEGRQDRQAGPLRTRLEALQERLKDS